MLILDYMDIVKALADEIAIIDYPVLDDELALHALNGSGPDFHEITPITLWENDKESS